MIVACVLRSGGHFNEGWVYALQEGTRRHAPEAEFVCLSDLSFFDVDKIELMIDLPGWWSKMFMFQRGLFTGRRVLYLDLDTVIVGDLSGLMSYEGHVAVLSDLYDPANMASGVMLWRGDEMAHIWDTFSRDPEGIMARHPRRMDHFLRKFLNKADRIQDFFPGQVVSYKADLRGRKLPYRPDQGIEIPNEARLVCMHGRPYLNELERDNPVRKAWGR